MYFLITNSSVIDIYSLAIRILYIIKIDFAGNTGNILTGNIGKILLKYLGYSNSIYIERYEYKIVIKLSLSNLPISH